MLDHSTRVIFAVLWERLGKERGGKRQRWKKMRLEERKYGNDGVGREMEGIGEVTLVGFNYNGEGD